MCHICSFIFAISREYHKSNGVFWGYVVRSLAGGLQYALMELLVRQVCAPLRPDLRAAISRTCVVPCNSPNEVYISRVVALVLATKDSEV